MKTPEFTRYDEFLQSKERATIRNWAVAYVTSRGRQHCQILQWENTDCKWYRPLPYEGKEEVGCYFQLWIDGPNSRIIHIRAI